MNTTFHGYDPARTRLNRVTTWKIFGHLSFSSPCSEATRVKLFKDTVRLLARQIHVPQSELRWVLKQEGNYQDKLYHFHFLLDGSNLPNKDAQKLAGAFGKLWTKVGGGNHEVLPHTVQLDSEGFQKSVNYITKIEGLSQPESNFFYGGQCQMKFSPALDQHISDLFAEDARQQDHQKD
jgi:hypothetical protein